MKGKGILLHFTNVLLIFAFFPNASILASPLKCEWVKPPNGTTVYIGASQARLPVRARWVSSKDDPILVAKTTFQGTTGSYSSFIGQSAVEVGVDAQTQYLPTGNYKAKTLAATLLGQYTSRVWGFRVVNPYTAPIIPSNFPTGGMPMDSNEVLIEELKEHEKELTGWYVEDDLGRVWAASKALALAQEGMLDASIERVYTIYNPKSWQERNRG